MEVKSTLNKNVKLLDSPPASGERSRWGKPTWSSCIVEPTAYADTAVLYYSIEGVSSMTLLLHVSSRDDGEAA